jgi:diguanylate cyclase (GGDEF)-like protein
VWLCILGASGLLTALATALLRPDLWVPGVGQVWPSLLLFGLVALGEALAVEVRMSHRGFYVLSPTYNLAAPLLVLVSPAALAGLASAAATFAFLMRRFRRAHVAFANAIDLQQMVAARLLMEAVPEVPGAASLRALLRAAVAYIALRGLSHANVIAIRVVSGYERPRDAARTVLGSWWPMDAAASIAMSGLLIYLWEIDRTSLLMVGPLSFSYAVLYLSIGESHRRIRAGEICPLTGLGTHAVLWSVLGKTLRSGHRVGFLLLDVDHFKRINDTRGHLEGDRVLREVAGAVLSAISVSDTAVRYGGEEFAVVLSDATIGGVRAAGERIRREVEARCGVTVSVGGAVAVPGADAAFLVEAADAALYRAKRGGRNRVVIWDGTVGAGSGAGTAAVAPGERGAWR